MPTKSHHADLIKRLASARYAAKYLKAALDDGDTQGFLLALRNVVQASRNVSSVARRSQVSRQHIHRLVAGEGNPTLKTLKSVLGAVGIDINFEPDRKKAA